MSNAIKHGRAKRITISLTTQRGRVVVSVSDNGTGLPAKLPKQRGMGLRIMQSRAGMIGGTLAIERSAAGGVLVVCSAPLCPSDKPPAPARCPLR